MRAWVCASLLVAACGGGGQDVSPDAAAVPVDATISSDAAISSDAGTDAPPSSACPMRTAPVGQPEGTVPLSAVHNGNYEISSQLDIDALAGIRVITGDLRVTVPTFDVLSLPDLEVVGRNFFVEDGGGRLTTIALPALETVGGTIQLSAPSATVTTLARLDSAGFDLHVVVGGMPASIPCLRTIEADLGVLAIQRPTALTFDRLRSIGRSIRAFDNAQLTALALPVLESVTRIEIRDNPQLVSFTTPALVQTTDIVMSGPQLSQLDFSSLESATSISLEQIAGVPTFSKLATTGNLVIGRSAASTLQFPLLVSAAAVYIYENLQLTSIAFPSLTTVTGNGSEFGAITNNPMLPTCQAVALAEQVMRTFQISGNDDTATCN